MPNRTNIVLAVALLFVVILTAMSHVDYSRPNIEVLPDMKYTPAWTAFSKNPNFRNERTLQEPVAGTIARGMMPLHFTATKEDAVRAGNELVNPFTEPAAPVNPPADETADASAQQLAQQAAQERLAQSVLRGDAVYRVYCISCHGPTGLGDGPVPQRGFPPPPSLLTGASRQMKDGQLFHILTYGQGSMSSLAGQLSVAQRWDAVNHVRSMQQSAPAPAQEPTPSVEDPPSTTDTVRPGERGDPPAPDQPASEPDEPGAKDADSSSAESDVESTSPDSAQAETTDPQSDETTEDAPEPEASKDDGTEDDGTDADEGDAETRDTESEPNQEDSATDDDTEEEADDT